MQAKTLVLGFLALPLAVLTGARADDLVAARATLLCKSAPVLARLTAPGHAAVPDAAARASGGCIDIVAGTRVSLVAAGNGTETVSVAIGGLPQRFFAPTGDFVAAPAEAPASDTSAPEAPASPAPEAAAPAAGASKPDLAVTGLQLGMTEDDAHTVLGPSYDFRPEAAFADPASAHVAAIGPDPDNTYRLGFVDGKLWFVNHMMVFHAGREPSARRLAQRLKAKYGPPTKETGPSADGYRASWQFDAAGTALSAPKEHCLADAAPPAVGAKDGAAFQSKFTNDCPATISVLALPAADDPARVARLQVILSSPEPMFQHLKQMDATLAAKKAAESKPAGH